MHFYMAMQSHKANVVYYYSQCILRMSLLLQKASLHNHRKQALLCLVLLLSPGQVEQ